MLVFIKTRIYTCTYSGIQINLYMFGLNAYLDPLDVLV